MKHSRVNIALLSVVLILVITGCTAVNASSPDALRKMIGQDHIGARREMADPALKRWLNSHIDESAEVLADKAASGASKAELLEAMGTRIHAIERDTLDTEDAESVASAFEAMLEPLGLDSSGGLLNTWMYGFDPS